MFTSSNYKAMFIHPKIRELAPVFAKVSTGVVNLTNFTTVIHEIILALDEVDPYGEMYGTDRQPIVMSAL